jgi:hypothetical protein
LSPFEFSREVNYALNSARSSQSQSSSSGEVAAKNVTGIQRPKVNYCLPDNGRLQISPITPAKVSQSPAALGNNVNDDISPSLSPETMSPKIEPPQVLSNDVETKCMPDNRADYQNTRSKRRVRSILAK